MKPQNMGHVFRTNPFTLGDKHHQACLEKISWYTIESWAFGSSMSSESNNTCRCKYYTLPLIGSTPWYLPKARLLRPLQSLETATGALVHPCHLRMTSDPFKKWPNLCRKQSTWRSAKTSLGFQVLVDFDPIHPPSTRVTAKSLGTLNSLPERSFEAIGPGPKVPDTHHVGWSGCWFVAPGQCLLVHYVGMFLKHPQAIRDHRWFWVETHHWKIRSTHPRIFSSFKRTELGTMSWLISGKAMGRLTTPAFHQKWHPSKTLITKAEAEEANRTSAKIW